MKFVLFDFSAWFHTVWNAAPEGDMADAPRRTMEAINACIGELEPDRVALCLDSKKSWRKEKVPYYKGNRKPKPPELFEQLDRSVKLAAASTGAPVYVSEGYEADDVIASLTKSLVGAGHNVAIATHDRDLLQLVQPRVFLWDLRKRRTFKLDDVAEGLGIPEKLRERFHAAVVEPRIIDQFRALCGDSSDNLKGLPGIGPAKALPLIEKFQIYDMFLEAEAAVANDGTPDMTKKQGEFLEQHRDRVLAEWELMRLNDADKLPKFPSAIDDLMQEQKPHDPPAPPAPASSPRTVSEAHREHEQAVADAAVPEDTPMECSNPCDKLFAALARAQAEMGQAELGSKNPHFDSKYASLASVFAASRPHMAKHGLCISQHTGQKYVQTLIGHASGQWMTAKTPVHVGRGSNQSQAYGSAVTYARRYGLSAMVGIAQADDDGNASGGRR